MKKVSMIAAALFLMAILLSPLGCETGPQGGPPPGDKAMMDGPPPGGPGGPGAKGGPGGPEGKGDPGAKGKGKAPQLTHEEFVELHDKNGDGEVSMEEFLGE